MFRDILQDPRTDVNFQTPVARISALIDAVDAGHMEYAYLLVDHYRVNVNLQDLCGESALHRVAKGLKNLVCVIAPYVF